MADKPSQTLLNAQKELEKRRRIAGVSYRPPRQSRSEQFQIAWPIPPSENRVVGDAEKQKPPPSTPVEPNAGGAAVRVAPSLAAWCLDKDHRYHGHTLDGPYRLYKILQTMDRDGRGWLANLFVEKALTKKSSSYYIYGRRQLKNMLRRGEGLFWQRVKSQGELRIRLVSRTKVARRLLASRLRGKEVNVPLRHMLGHGRGRQASVNAALYAAVHAGQIQREGKPSPISRSRLRDVSGCSHYRQRQYERRMGITTTKHIHVLGQYSEYKLQRIRLHRGLPAYRHTDFHGRINRHKKGEDYIAQRLPNSYRAPSAFDVISSRRQHTINRQLVGLCHMGSEGSDNDEYRRVFHENAAQAIKSCNQDIKAIAFWPMARSIKTQLWRSIA